MCMCKPKGTDCNTLRNKRKISFSKLLGMRGNKYSNCMPSLVTLALRIAEICVFKPTEMTTFTRPRSLYDLLLHCARYRLLTQHSQSFLLHFTYPSSPWSCTLSENFL